MARSRDQQRERDVEVGPPTRFAEGPPPTDFTPQPLPLMAVMEIQRTLGALTSAVDSLAKQDEKHSEKFDALIERLHKIENRIYAAGVIIALASGLLSMFLPKLMARFFGQ